MADTPCGRLFSFSALIGCDHVIGKEAAELQLARGIVMPPVGRPLRLVYGGQSFVYGGKIHIERRKLREATLCLVDRRIARLAVRAV